jgi:cell division protein FtsX
MQDGLKYYLPTINGDVMLMVYDMQFRLYLILLAICLIVALFPVYRLRRTSIIRFVTNRSRRHIFRNTMIGVQLAVSLFFLGGSLVTYQYIEDRKDKIYNPLTVEEQERVMLLEINNNYLKNNKEAIISEINRLPGICESLTMEGRRNEELKDTTGMNYYMDVIYADANYAEFFHIPVQGKEISADNDQTVFISPALQEMLNRNGMYNGNLIINNQSYIIGGIIPNTYQYDAYNPFGRDIGSVWKVSHEGNMYYFRIAPQADIAQTIKQVRNVIEKYVPSTLPLNLHQLTDEKFNRLAHIETTGVLATVLAVISILLVVFSIYSAISLDTQNRQKEMAIRKINGATPKDIAFLFGKSYGLMFLLSYLFVYPLERYVFTQVFLINAGNNWDWPIIVLAVMTALIVSVTAYKIREIMHINPALILKKE